MLKYYRTSPLLCSKIVCGQQEISKSTLEVLSRRFCHCVCRNRRCKYRILCQAQSHSQRQTQYEYRTLPQSVSQYHTRCPSTEADSTACLSNTRSLAVEMRSGLKRVLSYNGTARAGRSGSGTVSPLTFPRMLSGNAQADATPVATFSNHAGDTDRTPTNKQRTKRFGHGPSFKEFLHSQDSQEEAAAVPAVTKHLESERESLVSETIPYVPDESVSGIGRKVYIETYGCQMNVNDTEIAWAILQKSGFIKTGNIKESDVILAMTCSVREGAEQKIWKRLEYFKHLKKVRARGLDSSRVPLKIGIIGCMAERLKTKILEKEQLVDVICGPDAYRDLPRMLSVIEPGQAAVNVLLSLDETYADVLPVRINDRSPSAFVSIMRGCDNMCTYCIVPFTRGRERSRPLDSIVHEIKLLSDQGIKEVTLLGQNVNSYRDTSQITAHGGHDLSAPNLSKGFSTVYKPKTEGRTFIDLLDRVSAVDPEIRIRFTSPHPKDFPDQVLHLIRDRANICKQLHLPAQSGSTRMLEAMGRGYTREAYLELVEHIRQILPNVSLSSDFIAGFCGETEDDHKQSVSLMKQVQLNFAFCFLYSLRQKTRAHHRLRDDVPPDVKARRHDELVDVFRAGALLRNQSEIGNVHLVLLEGNSKRSSKDLVGRNDGNTKVILPHLAVPVHDGSDVTRPINVGDYVAVKITNATSQVMQGVPMFHSTVQQGVRAPHGNWDHLARS